VFQKPQPVIQRTEAIQEKEKPQTGRTVNATHLERPFYHKVIRGETLSSIARKYGVTLRNLRKENRDIRFPQVGDSLRIPGMKVAMPGVQVSEIEADTLTVPEELPDTPARPSELTPVTGLSGSYDVAVMLPFHLWENSRRYEIDSSRVVAGKEFTGR